MDRDQVFLLPPDMRDWLAEDHLVWFVIDVVRQLDTRAFHARARLGGAGREGYDPDMLVGLLVYAYCHGVRSSRQIERLCGTDVAFRVLCAQDTPDHTVIARFRQAHEGALAGLFDQVLLLCAKAGLGRFGTVALDGTKIAANASAGANRSESGLRRIAEEMIADAAATDAAEDAEYGAARGDELPQQWRDRSGRPARIREALGDIAAERERRDAEYRAEQVAQASERVDRAEQTVERERAALVEQATERAARERAAAVQGRRLPGTRPVPVEEHTRMRRAGEQLAKARQALTAAEQATAAGPVSEAVRNSTDPQSRLMPVRGGGWVQGYNCQLAVTADGLIVATRVGNHPNDVQQFVPMMTEAVTAARIIRRATGRRDAKIGVLLADAGYASDDNLTVRGPDRLIALGKRRDVERAARQAENRPPPAETASAREKMKHRLATPDGVALYRRRGATVEPVNGILKDRRGLRRFARRGLSAAHSELRFAAAATNLLKLHTAQLAAAG